MCIRDSCYCGVQAALNESAQLGSSTILECRVPHCAVNIKQHTMEDGDGTPRHSKTVKHIIRYEQKFKPEYCSEFKFILKSRAGETYAFCTLCRLSASYTAGRTT